MATKAERELRKLADHNGPGALGRRPELARRAVATRWVGHLVQHLHLLGRERWCAGAGGHREDLGQLFERYRVLWPLVVLGKCTEDLFLLRHSTTRQGRTTVHSGAVWAM